MHVKFQFFKDVASILNPFLNMYQTDQPMMIFLCEDLEDMYRRLVKMVVHKAIIDKARTPVHLIKIDLDDKLNILSPSKLILPTATIHLLQGIEQGKKLRFKTLWFIGDKFTKKAPGKKPTKLPNRPSPGLPYSKEHGRKCC